MRWLKHSTRLNLCLSLSHLNHYVSSEIELCHAICARYISMIHDVQPYVIIINNKMATLNIWWKMCGFCVRHTHTHTHHSDNNFGTVIRSSVINGLHFMCSVCLIFVRVSIFISQFPASFCWLISFSKEIIRLVTLFLSLYLNLATSSSLCFCLDFGLWTLFGMQ